jgi:hypothetical protein
LLMGIGYLLGGRGGALIAFFVADQFLCLLERRPARAVDARRPGGR